MRLPDFSFEKKLWRKGFEVVAGVDEVGRGSFAGPVVAAAVAFAPMNNPLRGKNFGIRIDDSKKLRPRQRERAEKWIKENALSWGIGEAPTSLINRIGMGRATRIAFRKAISEASAKLDVGRGKMDNEDRKSKMEVRKLKYQTSKIKLHNRASNFQLPTSIEFLLIDAFYIPYVDGLRRKNQKAIIDGDEKSLSIAAASIIAKVYRDKMMLSLSKNYKYKRYGWGRNKGYGTKEHRQSIIKYGTSRYHRKIFVESWLGKLT